MVWITRLLQIVLLVVAWRARFPGLAVWMAVCTVQSLAIVVLGANAWYWTEPAFAAGCLVAVMETYMEMTRPIRRVGRAGIFLILAGAALGFGVMRAYWNPSLGIPAVLRAAIHGKAVAMAIMAGALLVPWILFRRLPLAVSPRVASAGRIMLVYLMAFAVFYWLAGRVATRGQGAVVNATLSVSWAACLCGWLWAMRQSGAAPHPPRLDDDLEDYARRVAALVHRPSGSGANSNW